MKKTITIFLVALLALTALSQAGFSQVEERQRAREEERRQRERELTPEQKRRLAIKETSQLLVGVWRVRFSREKVREIRVFEDLTVREGEERGQLELKDPHNLLVHYRGKVKGFEFHFKEHDTILMVRSHDEERWVSCERVRGRERR